MKRTDRLTNIIALLLFLALAAYIAAYAVRALRDTTVTAEAVAAEFDLGATASGIVVRQEVVLSSGEPYIDVTAAEGAKVAAGSAVATAVSSEQGMERANRIHELEREIARISAALQGLRSAEDLTTREASMTSTARQLAAAVARHDVASLNAVSTNLSALLIGVEDDDVSPERLAALERELQSLRNSTSSGAETLTAPVSGVFSSVVDGYEHLNDGYLKNLSPSKLRRVIADRREPEEGAYGKLVSGYQWYFAAVMRSTDAANLRVGRTARLNFGRYYSADVYGRVTSISAIEDGNVAVVFRCSTALADTLSMREVSASVVFGSYSGIRVPAQAVRTDEETEATYVWTVTAMQLERKDVEIIYAGDGFVIVRRGSEPGSLREGNTVVVSGKDLYEGKIME